MRILFKTKKLQKTCSVSKETIKQFGVKRGLKLQQRLMELKAAETLAEISHLPPPRCHELSGDRAGQLSVDLAHPYRLLFVVANEPAPMKDNGELDWAKVTEIKIIGIVDTH
ncbi:type II toxin-antitoxin system RelE/ParE family toxin [Desulforhopalus sp. IMCC35007]|uniref:type II toxin-antitoxin system RelE/ParE family toxin n=1 Tax=Desulforhopalus sp. IMCC35007 TaxID=2569543 RepID=UPI0010AE1FDB|nr:killer suppression protein [Desulforhopalus sp. IMCC35007]TKB11802.1 killer suppression protein [Desulforhopalus sp. IMCC35007]